MADDKKWRLLMTWGMIWLATSPDVGAGSHLFVGFLFLGAAVVYILIGIMGSRS